MRYIQRKDYDGNLETVDEFESRKEAINNLKEYRIYDTSAYYYISQNLAEIGKKAIRRKANGMVNLITPW